MKAIRTQADIRRTHRRLIACVGAFLLCLVVICASWAAIHASLKQQGAQSLQASVLESANQCYAVEGAYPISLEYLQDYYGLVFDESEYQIDYEIFAENIAPKVKVTVK